MLKLWPNYFLYLSREHKRSRKNDSDIVADPSTGDERRKDKDKDKDKSKDRRDRRDRYKDKYATVIYSIHRETLILFLAQGSRTQGVS